MKGQWDTWVEPTGVAEKGNWQGQRRRQNRGLAVMEGEEVGRTLAFSLDDRGRNRRGKNG